MSKLYRILYITKLVELGGGEKSLFYTVEKLDKNRFQPLVLCNNIGSLTSELKKSNIKVTIFTLGVAKKLWGFVPVISISSIIRFWKLLIREEIDLVHSNCFSGVVFASIPTKLMKIPLVWTVHGWTSGGGVQGYLINFFVDKILTVSNAVRKFILKFDRISSEKVETVFLGVNLEEYSNINETNKIRKEFGINKSFPLIGMIGRFQRVKGHYYFFKATKNIKKECPQAKFMIVGARIFERKSDKGYPEEIIKWTKEFGLENDIILTGFRNDITDILSALDVLVLPSLRESFGLVLVEAMAAGVPVVATRCEGPEDIVENNVSGILVPVKDSEALSKAVLFLLKNREKTNEMISTAKKRVEKLFNVYLQTKRIESIYDDLLSDKK